MISLSMTATVIKGTPEDKEKLPQIIREHKEWLEDHTKGRRACLADMNLADADLSGMDLSYADLSGAYLKGAKLVETKLTNAILDGASLDEANLTKADLTGAYMSRVSVCHACLEEASMPLAVMRGSVLWNSNFKGANLKGAILTWAQLCDCKFEDAHLELADLYSTNLDYAKFTGASLKYARLKYAKWIYYADFTNADVTGDDFSDCDLDEEKFVGAIGFHPHMRCPEEGPFIAWKKCREDHIVKLLIPTDAMRTGASRYDCRASEAKVLEIRDQDNEPCEEALSCADEDFVYRKGETVYPEEEFDDTMLTGGSGIHFFLTRTEAELFEYKKDEDDADQSEEDDANSLDESDEDV
ncbi:MAG: pentapeptide repeat-containing protein [Eubacterium sp.]|nr:pentapeptide repeat-containing protein [Eubacterium sp.]